MEWEKKKQDRSLGAGFSAGNRRNLKLPENRVQIGVPQCGNDHGSLYALQGRNPESRMVME